MSGADQFTFFPCHRLAIVVPHLHIHTQALALQFTAPDWQGRVAQGEAGDDVGAAGNRRQAQVTFHVAVDVLEALVSQWRAGGKNGLEAAQLVAFTRYDAGFLQCGDELGAGAEDGDVLGVDQIDQAGRFGMEGRAVVEHQGGAQGQAGNQPVPHHPAAGGVVEQSVVEPKVGMQAQLLDVLQQGAADAVDNALGHASGAAGIEDIQRLVEGHRRELRRAAGLVEILPAGR